MDPGLTACANTARHSTGPRHPTLPCAPCPPARLPRFDACCWPRKAGPANGAVQKSL